MFDNIHTQDVAEIAGKLLQPVNGPVGSFPDSIGIAVKNKALFKPWFDYIAEGMVDNSIPEGCCADQPFFGLMDGKICIGAWLVTMVLELLLQIYQMVSQLKFKAGSAFPSPFATRCFTGCRQQVFPGGYLIKQVIQGGGLHGA